MTQNFASWITLYLAQKLTPGGALVVTADPWTDGGRLFFRNNNQVEWIDFTSVTPSWSYFALWGLTRDIDQYAIPATSNSTGKTWLATQSCVLVQMHDQIVDKNVPQQIIQEWKTYATTAARDTALWADWVATFAYTDIYVIATWLFYNYNLSSWQWEAIDTWTVTPNASTTVAGKVEIATSAQSITGTDTGETGALLSVLPSDIAKNEQSGTFKYWVDAWWDDTYVVALTPVLASYTTWQELSFKVTTSNTWACTVDFWPGAKSIKRKDGTDPVNGEVTGVVNVVYDGTNFVLQDQEKIDMAYTTTAYSASVTNSWSATTTSVLLTRGWLLNITWSSYEDSSTSSTTIVRLEYSTDDTNWFTAVEFWNWDPGVWPWVSWVFTYLWNAWVYVRWYVSSNNNIANAFITMTVQQRN